MQRSDHVQLFRAYLFEHVYISLASKQHKQAVHYKVYAGQTVIGLRLLGLDYRTPSDLSLNGMPDISNGEPELFASRTAAIHFSRLGLLAHVVIVHS